MNCDFLHQSQEQPEKEDIFSLLYDNHNYYLDIEPEQKLLKHKTNPPIPVQALKYFASQKSFSVENHLRYLSFIQKEYEMRRNAANKIQKYWKSCLDCKIFSRLKLLIYRYTSLEPALALKIVNPREASILDAASGTVVRFKLAGSTFPPHIVYKIFSYHPVIRVNPMFVPNCQRTPQNEYTQFCSFGTFTENYKSEMITNYRTNISNDWRLYEVREKEIRGNIMKNESDKCLSVRKNRMSFQKSKKKSKEIGWIKQRYGF